jgi:ABC-type histidine transport system ATPase subunit
VRIFSLRIENFGPFRRLEEIRLGQLATIVGQNDAGKSHILRALQLFFDDGRLTGDDIHSGTRPDDTVLVEVAFDQLPAVILLEDGMDTTLQEEMLVDAGGRLRMRRRWPCSTAGERSLVSLVTSDYADARYAGLRWIKDRELAERAKDLPPQSSSPVRARGGEQGIGRRGAARSRVALRVAAGAAGVPLVEREVELGARDPVRRLIESLLPRFELFETDTRLSVGETTFQSQFRPIVRAAAENPAVVAAREAFTQAIAAALQGEVEEIFMRMRRHTNALAALTAQPAFAWDRAVTFEILGRDTHNVERSLDQRGSGMRRLLMVAFFQYLAEKQRGDEVIYAVEEPENCLHPGLQRELAESFADLAAEGAQVILTSHSPVFAGASPVHDLVLVERHAGIARATQEPDRARIAEELGIEPADQITGYRACVFVEGTSDIYFWRTVARTLKAAGLLEAEFEECGIGLMPSGGGTLKQWITMRALGRLSRRFLAVMDSDRESAVHPLPESTLRRQHECMEQGGACIILRKREIENYLHPEALARAGYGHLTFHDFSDVKALYDNKRIAAGVEHMTAAEILTMDRYKDSYGEEHHELLEIARTILALPERAGRRLRTRGHTTLVPAIVPHSGT